MSRLHKFLGISNTKRCYLVEAWFWLVAAKLALMILPFRWIAPALRRQMVLWAEGSGLTSTEHLDYISWAVTTASRHLPWDCKCLVQAVAGKAMLSVRGVPSNLCLGLAKTGEAQLQAHAWLRCGERILTGWQGMEVYTVIASFAEDGK
jgi:hypothetical protein